MPAPVPATPAEALVGRATTATAAAPATPTNPVRNDRLSIEVLPVVSDRRINS
jgi:hypothetical protein